MRSVLAILIFLAATALIIFSQAQAQPSLEVPPSPPSCGTCGRANPYVKFCGKLRGDLIYSLEESETAKSDSKSQVELCLDLPEGGMSCGVSSDPLLITSLNTMLGVGVSSLCMKVDASSDTRKIVLIQGRH